MPTFEPLESSEIIKRNMSITQNEEDEEMEDVLNPLGKTQKKLFFRNLLISVLIRCW